MCNTVLLKCNGYVTCIGSKKRKCFWSNYALTVQGKLGYCNDQSNDLPSIEIKKHIFFLIIYTCIIAWVFIESYSKTTDFENN